MQTDLNYEVVQEVPYDKETEEALIGSVLYHYKIYSELRDIKPSDFFIQKHAWVWEAFESLYSNSIPFDLLTITKELERAGKLEDIGGMSYLIGIENNAYTSLHAQAYAEKVKECSLRRRMLAGANQQAVAAFNRELRTDELLAAVAIQSQNIQNCAPINSMVTAGKAANDMYDILDAVAKSGKPPSIPCGFYDLDKILQGFYDDTVYIFATRPGCGKCLGKGTKILMFDGSLKEVENITTGDRLMGADSTPRKVLSLSRGKGQMYWIRQNKGTDYRVNENHILSLKRSKTEWCHHHGDIENISIKDVLANEKYIESRYKGYKVPVEFPETELPVEPYFIGLWLGDGNTNDVRITNVDLEVVEYLYGYAKRLGKKIAITKNREVPSYGITGSFKENHSADNLTLKMRALNLIGNKHIPQEYLVSSRENRMQLLAGLLDSDGNCNSGVEFEITQKDEHLANQIKFLADSLGFRTSIHSKKAEIKNIGFVGTVYRVQINGKTDLVPTKIIRKRAKLNICKCDQTVTGFIIEKDTIDNFYGFELDGDGLFLLEDMTVTHNSTILFDFARHAAVKRQKHVAIFSLEMSETQVIRRLIGAEWGVSSSNIKSGRLEDGEWSLVTSGLDASQSWPITIDATPGITIETLAARASILRARGLLDMLIIDYIQLVRTVSGWGDRNRNRQQEIGHITRTVKEIAKSLHVPVICAAQVNRMSEQSGDKKLRLSHLREAGDIEQDADCVVFLQPPSDEQPIDSPIVDIEVAKQRDGATGVCQLINRKKYPRFESIHVNESQDWWSQ